MFKVEFYTPDGFIKTVDADTLNVYSNDGQRGILENHMPIILSLIISKLEIILNNQHDYYAIGNGTLFFKDNVAKVIVETLEHKDDIDIKRAEDARDRALNRLESKDSSFDIKRAKIALTKALTRIDVFKS